MYHHNRAGSNILISGPIISSLATNSRTESYFTSVARIYDNVSIKFQSLHASTQITNLMFGIGDGTFTQNQDPRLDILYSVYLNDYIFNLRNGGLDWGILYSATGQSTTIVYTTNTIFEIRIINGFVSFLKDGVVLWSPKSSRFYNSKIFNGYNV